MMDSFRCLNSFFFFFFAPLFVTWTFVFCVIQIAQSKLSLVAVAEASPLVSVLTSSKSDSGGLIIVGPEGG